MQTTTNYGLKIYEGTDLFNPLTVENVNTSDLDTIVKGISNAAVGTATELLTGTVHALTRADTARNVFHFTATANYEAGETFEVDGVQVTAKTPDGQNLSTGAYVINSSVLCILDGTLLTVIVNPAKALDADKLDGHDSTYFATAGDLTVLDNQVGAISTKVGTGVLDVGNDCVDGINTLNTHLSGKAEKEWTLKGIAAGSNTVAFPESWNEILVTCYNPANRRSAGFIFHLTPAMVDKHEIFVGGYNGSGSTTGFCSIDAGSNAIKLSSVNINGSDSKANFSFMVEYR